MTKEAVLGDVLLGIEAGKSFLTSERLARENELGVLKVSAVTWSAFRPDEAKAVLSHEPDEHHRIRANDLVISRANTVELVGAVVLVEKDHPLRLLSDKTLRLVVDEGRVDKHYLLYALRSKRARKHIEYHATGTSNSMRNIGHDTIVSIPIVLPDLNEQRCIAKRLHDQFAAAQSAREPAKLLAREIEALRAAIYRNAYADVAPMSVLPNLPTSPCGWHWAKQTDVSRLESGHTPSRSRPDWWGGDVSWISLTEIRGFDGRWVEETRLRTNAAGIANSAARILPRGTVCFSRTASVGFVALMARPMATSQDFANWVCGDQLDPEFLMHALIRSRAELRALATGATHKTIYMPTLASFHICMPPLPEQKRIVKRLNEQLAAVAQARQAAQQQLAEIERLPSRLLAQAFEST